MRVNTLYSTKEVLTEQGRRMELRYYLIQDIRSRMVFGHKQDGESVAEHEPSQERITYGIRIVKIEGEQEEQECLPGLSARMESVERLLKQMVYGLVTPTSAVAIADDWAAMEYDSCD